jgi:hypothetical protein
LPSPGLRTTAFPEHAVQAHFCPEVDSLGDCICWASLREAEVIEGLKSIDKTTPKALTDGIAMWEEDNGFVYYKGRFTCQTIGNFVKMWYSHVMTC